MKEETIRKTARRLVASRTRMIGEAPFFGRLMMHLKTGVSDCGTAYTDMQNIVFDPEFAEALSDDELDFVYLHEIMHCVLNHCIRGKGYNNLIYNVAADIVVNSMLFEFFGLSDFTVASSKVMHIAPNGKEGRCYTAEEIYLMLITADDKKLGHFCRLNGLNITIRITDRDNLVEKLKEIAEKGTFDSHDVWQKIENAQMVKDMWNTHIKKASKSCGDGSGIPQGLERYYGNVLSQGRLDWKQLLNDFIRHNKDDYSYCVPDKRYSGDIIMPSFQSNMFGDCLENIWFLVDTSGSISDKMVAQVYSEIRSCISQMDDMTGMLSFFDTKVSEPVEFSDEEELLDIKPVGGGGTSFYEIFRFMKEYFDEGERPSAVIVLTDGYADFPSEKAAMNVPVMWIISDSGEKAPWGNTVNIN